MSNHEDDPFYDGSDDVEHGEVEQVEAEQADGAGEVEAELNDGDVEGTEEQAESAEQDGEPTALSPEDQAKADAKAKAEADEATANAALESFKETVNGVLGHEDVDTATGDVPVVLVDKVAQAYAALPGAKYKGAGKTWLQELMQDLMVKMKFIEARSVMNLLAVAKVTKASKPETLAKPKVDPTEAFASRAAGVLLAASLLAVPDGVEDTWAEKAEALAASLSDEVVAYKAWLDDKSDPKPEAPKVSDVVLAAAKIAAGRAVGTTKRASSSSTGGTRTSTPAGDGVRRDIGKHIAEAIQSVGVGEFMPISAIAKFESQEYAGTAPSQGAISARLFPGGDASKCNLDFVRPEGKDEGHPAKGAVRVA